MKQCKPFRVPFGRPKRTKNEIAAFSFIGGADVDRCLAVAVQNRVTDWTDCEARWEIGLKITV